MHRTCIFYSMRKRILTLCSCLLLPALAWAQPAHAPHDGMGGRENRWIRTLPEEHQATARALLQEGLADIARLRAALGAKVNALADLNYNEATPPEALLQLGRELQESRNALRERLARLLQELQDTVGATPAFLRERGHRMYRLSPHALPPEVDKN